MSRASDPSLCAGFPLVKELAFPLPVTPVGSGNCRGASWARDALAPGCEDTFSSVLHLLLVTFPNNKTGSLVASNCPLRKASLPDATNPDPTTLYSTAELSVAPPMTRGSSFVLLSGVI